MAFDIKKAKERLKALEGEKALWNTHWQLVAEYVLQRKANFQTFEEQGAFLHSDIWDDSAGRAAETAASALIGMLWPDSTSFKLEPSHPSIRDNEEAKTFFSEATEKLHAAMDEPLAGLSLALDEFALDFLVFGTPALFIEEDEDTDFKFQSWNLSQFAIAEGASGMIDTIYRVYRLTVSQVVEEFGIDKVSKKVADAYQKGKLTDKIKIVHMIEPRKVIHGVGGNKNMPIASVHFEHDSDTILRERGYNEMPALVARFSKRINETYGRSPAMNALPTIMELNAVREAVTVAMEKNLDPPLMVFDDGVFGAGVIDTSAGAINVMNIGSKFPQGRSPIEPIYTTGTFNDVLPLIESLQNTISDHFMIDRLLDMNNETQMTAREALIRDNMRTMSLRSVINRVYTEVINRMIERCFNIMYRNGRFGYPINSPELAAAEAMRPDEYIPTIPDAIVKLQGKGERAFTIKYMTPAARRQQSDEAQGMLSLTEYVGSVMAIKPDIIDRVDFDFMVKRLGETYAIPDGAIASDKNVDAIRKARSDQAAQQQNIQTLSEGASIAKDVAQAQNAVASPTQI